MMKKHRASWARTAGGAAALSIVGAAGLALATPGFAQEESAAPVEVLANSRNDAPIIARVDVERLREKCASGERSRGAIVCSDADAKDPEVRAIMEKTRKRVQERVAHVKLDRKEMVRIRKDVTKAAKEQRLAMKQAEKALEAARPHLDRLESGEHRAEIEQAMAHAREHMNSAHFRKLRSEAIRNALANARIEAEAARIYADRIRFARLQLDSRHFAEIAASIERAQKDLEKLEIEVDVPDFGMDLERELGPLIRER